MNFNTLKSATIILTLMATPLTSRAENIAIITHPSVSSELSVEQVRRIYMGRTNQLPDGSKVVPLVIDHADPAYTRFANKVMRRSPKQLKSYWAKRLFTGKSKPPQAVSSFALLKQLVASDPKFIGFYSPHDISDQTVRTLVTFDET